MSIGLIAPTRTRLRGASQRRAAGQHERTIVLRLRMRTLLTLGLLAVLTGLLGRSFGLRSPLFVGSELALLATMFAVSRVVLPLLDRHDRGATGEEQVGGLLEQLHDDEWHVIHDAQLTHGNVDHIVIGPGGIFALETKSHPGPIALARIHGATFRQAHANAQALERLTGERAQALIVYSRAWVDRPLARRRGVRVVPARMLIRFLRGHGPALERDQVRKAARRVERALLERGAPTGRLWAWPRPSPKSR